MFFQPGPIVIKWKHRFKWKVLQKQNELLRPHHDDS